MAVVIGAVTTATTVNGAGTTTFSFVCNGNTLYVMVSAWFGGTGDVTGVTFNGTALTSVSASGIGSGGDAASIWRLAAPAATTANVVITHSAGNAAGAAAAFTASGQDSTTPEGTAAHNKSAANGTSTGSLAITGAATGDATIVVMANGAAAAVTPSATGGTPTEDYDIASNGDEAEGFHAPDAVTAVSASWAGSSSWVIAALPLKATAAAAATSLVMPHNPLAAMIGR
jgi:hypothetical protein